MTAGLSATSPTFRSTSWAATTTRRSDLAVLQLADRDPECLDRLRCADVEALGEVDAELADGFQRRPVHHELGDRLVAHALGDLDDRPHDGLVDAVLGQLPDEVAVDLEVVE